MPAPKGVIDPGARFRARCFDRWLEGAGWLKCDPRQLVWKWSAHSPEIARKLAAH